MHRKFVPIILVSFFAFGSASADDIADRMRACAQESDESRRLACYDAAAGISTSPAESANSAESAQVAASAAAPAAAVDAAGVAAPAAAAAVDASSVAAPAAAAAVDADAEAARAAAEEFGMNREMEKKIPVEEREEELREISAVAVEVRYRPSGEHIVTLDNGQTWVEKYAVYGFRVEEGDTVLVRKGVFGGYKMIGRGRRSSQVRRVD